MTTIGWIVMAASVGSVAALFLWCLYRVLTTGRSIEKLHGVEDVEPPATKKD